MARLIPVLDVMGGRVVRAVGGRRSEYQPLVSKLTDSTEPVEVARRLLDATGADELYVADLDEITNPGTSTGLTAQLADALPNTKVMADQGIRTPEDAARIPFWRRRNRLPLIGWQRRMNVVPVVGTETLDGPAALDAVINGSMNELVVSIDMFDGRWLGKLDPWRERGLTEHADVIVLADVLTGGYCDLLFLDLSRVGTGTGPGTEEWVRRAKLRFCGGSVYVGGGIRDRDDVARLADAGADAVLVASALHDGMLP